MHVVKDEDGRSTVFPPKAKCDFFEFVEAAFDVEDRTSVARIPSLEEGAVVVFVELEEQSVRFHFDLLARVGELTPCRDVVSVLLRLRAPQRTRSHRRRC